MELCLSVYRFGIPWNLKTDAQLPLQDSRNPHLPDIFVPMGSTSKEARSPLSLRKHRGCGHGLAGRAFTQEQLWFHVQRMGFSFPFILSVLSVQRASFFGGSEGVAEGSSAHGGLPVRNMLLDHFGISSVHPLRQDPWLYTFTDTGISMYWQFLYPFTHAVGRTQKVCGVLRN